MFVDAIVVKIRDGKVTNRPVYVAIGVTVNGERDILGLWAGDGSVLRGLPDSVTTAWPLTPSTAVSSPAASTNPMASYAVRRTLLHQLPDLNGGGPVRSWWA